MACDREREIRYIHIWQWIYDSLGLLVVIGGVCATVVTISLRIFNEDGAATNSECPVNAC